MEEQHYAFVLVADQKYWKRLCESNKAGKKTHAFVRRNQVGPTNAKKLLFYIKKPVMTICGQADFIERCVADGKSLWASYGEQTCFENYDEYAIFLSNRPVATFLRFKNLTQIPQPKPPKTVKKLLGSPKRFMGKYVDWETAEQMTT